MVGDVASATRPDDLSHLENPDTAQHRLHTGASWVCTESDAAVDKDLLLILRMEILIGLV